MIINTAILTNQPVSLPVIVLAIDHDGKVSDVTSAVTCHSTNENTVKVQHNLSKDQSDDIRLLFHCGSHVQKNSITFVQDSLSHQM